MMEDIKNIIESLLLVTEEPLTIDRIKNILIEPGRKEIQTALTELSAEYEARKGGFLLREVAGGYQICTRPEYREWIKRLLQPKPLRLSKAALEKMVFVESFNSKMRDELLNREIFYTIKEAKVIIEQWRQYYNTERPHSSLNYNAPVPQSYLLQVGLETAVRY